jgi:hypothetical protein
MEQRAANGGCKADRNTILRAWLSCGMAYRV